MWRLGSSRLRTIGHTGRCRADFTKPIAPKFSAPYCQLLPLKHFCHCLQQKMATIPSALRSGMDIATDVWGAGARLRISGYAGTRQSPLLLQLRPVFQYLCTAPGLRRRIAEATETDAASIDTASAHTKDGGTIGRSCKTPVAAAGFCLDCKACRRYQSTGFRVTCNSQCARTHARGRQVRPMFCTDNEKAPVESCMTAYAGAQS